MTPPAPRDGSACWRGVVEPRGRTGFPVGCEVLGGRRSAPRDLRGVPRRTNRHVNMRRYTTAGEQVTSVLAPTARRHRPFSAASVRRLNNPSPRAAD